MAQLPAGDRTPLGLAYVAVQEGAHVKASVRVMDAILDFDKDGVLVGVEVLDGAAVLKLESMQRVTIR